MRISAPCSLRAGVVAVHVLDAHLDLVRDLAFLRRHAVAAHVADDHRAALPHVHLRTVVVADLDALDKPERGAQPVDRRPHVRVDQDRDDGGRGDRSVRPHPRSLGGVHALGDGRAVGERRLLARRSASASSVFTSAASSSSSASVNATCSTSQARKRSTGSRAAQAVNISAGT